MSKVLPDNYQAYATLYFRSIRHRDEHFKAIGELGLKGEIYFEYGWDRLDLAAHKRLAEVIRGELPGCAVHLPFYAFSPGRPDPAGAQINLMLRALEAAAAYEPDHLIGHADYSFKEHSAAGAFSVPKNDSLTGPAHVPSSVFLNNSATFWLSVMDASPARLFLENTHEHSPLAILSVLSLLTDRAAMCLDLGHWFHYAMGRDWGNLATWLEMAGDRVAHLHLHDNNGEGDQHLGLGEGALNLPEAWGLLAQHLSEPSFTLENHRLEGLVRSVGYLGEHPLF
jgi:sugar phosphate isomerase/epimerase